MTINFRVIGAAIAVVAIPAFVNADVDWDVSVPWSPKEFHSINAENFARKVEEETNGEVVMTVHAGGALGIRANESLRALEDGAVQMAEYALFQQVGEVPLLGIESIPFLIKFNYSICSQKNSYRFSCFSSYTSRDRTRMISWTTPALPTFWAATWPSAA